MGNNRFYNSTYLELKLYSSTNVQSLTPYKVDKRTYLVDFRTDLEVDQISAVRSKKNRKIN